MAQSHVSFFRAGTGGRRKNIRIAALCALAGVMAAQPAGARRGDATDHGDSASEQLIGARNNQAAGKYNAARYILLQALPTAPNSPLLLNQLGSVEQDLGEYIDAERSYLRALSAYTQTGDDPERLVILNNLGTLYFETAQYAKGDRIREQLEKLGPETLEGHPAAAGMLLSGLASLEHARNRDHEAETYYARSLQLFQIANGIVSVDAALVKNSLGGLRLEAGEYDAAGDLFRQAIREIEIASGPESPALVRPLVNLARCENMGGHANRAEPPARRAVELSIKIFGQDHPVTATAMLEKATALRRLGQKGSARELEKRAKASLRSNSRINLTGYTVSLRDLAGASTR